MSGSAPATIVCPHCQERFAWQPMLAGRRIRCHCGQMIDVPAARPGALGTSASPGVVLEARIEVAAPLPARQAPPPQPKPPKPKAAPAAPMAEPVSEPLPVAAPVEAPPTASAESAPPLGSLYLEAMSTKSKIKADPNALAPEEPQERPRFLDFHLPLILGIGGMVAGIALFQTFAHSVLDGLLAWGMVLAFQLFVFLPTGVAGLSITARMMDVGFGVITQAIFKLAAVTLGTGAVADALFLAAAFQMDFDQYTLMFGFFLYLVFCGAPLAIMFGIGLAETALLVTIMMAPRLALIFGLGIAAPQIFN